MTRIYAFPPAGLVGVRLMDEQQVRRSRFALNGRRAVSTVGPSRRLVDLTVSALAKERAGAGYMAELWRYIDGGMHLVRLTIPPQNWHLDHTRGQATVGTLTWTEGGDPIGWTSGGDPIGWTAETVRFGTPVSLAGYPAAISVTGLPALQIVARPGDIIHVTDDLGTITGTARVLDVSRSNASGVSVIPLASALSTGPVILAGEESAVFEVVSYDPQQQPVGNNWTVSLGLREVLASEYSGATEFNPWRS